MMIDFLFSTDWSKVFLPDTPLVEIFVRGTVMYFGILLLLRFVLKRETSTLNRSDLLVAVLIADAAQNGMADDYRSVTDGLLLVATILLWTYALDWLSYRFQWARRLVQADPLILYRDGQLFRRHMRQELITYEELLTSVREAGYADLNEIQEIYMEGNGALSVVPLRQSS